MKAYPPTPTGKRAKTISKFICCMAAGVLSMSASASPNDFPSLDNKFAPTSNPNAVIKLPFNDMLASEYEGQILFLTKNGRFAIFGQMIDLWADKELTSLEDIARSTQRIDIAYLGLEKLKPIKLGRGPQPVVVFVDALEPHSMDLLEQIKTLNRLLPGRYTFNIVVIHALGENSLRRAKALFCAKEKSRTLDVLLSKQLPTLEQDAGCTASDYEATLVMANLMGIQGVPFLIAPDGRFHTGIPKRFSDWLADDKK